MKRAKSTVFNIICYISLIAGACAVEEYKPLAIVLILLWASMMAAISITERRRQ